MVVGSGVHTYEVVEGWGRLPPGWEFNQVPAIAVDSQDRVRVLTRGAHPVMVFDPVGNLISAWGEGLFSNPHGMCVGPDDSYYFVDNDAHVVMKFSSDGKHLMTLNNPGKPADPKTGAPFNRPAGVCVSPSGEIFVADGYGNSRVHKFAPNGALLLSWGSPGDGPGEFHLPHGIALAKDGRVFVADRENRRVQIFTPQGEFITQWTDLYRPADIFIDDDQNVYVAELNHRITIFNMKGELLARWGGSQPSKEPGSFTGPHGVCVDSRGDLYVGEVLEGRRVQKFVKRPQRA